MHNLPFLPWLSNSQGKTQEKPSILGSPLGVIIDLWSDLSFIRESPPANQTKERSVHELFAGAFTLNKSSMWIVLVFLRKNTRIHKNGRNSWTFHFGPFFGLVCRGDSWFILLCSVPESLYVIWWVPNPPFPNPGVAEKAPWRSLQSGVAGVYSLLEIPTASSHFPSHLTPSFDPDRHFARSPGNAILVQIMPEKSIGAIRVPVPGPPRNFLWGKNHRYE